MRDLKVIGLEPDGKHLVLADESGNRFRLAADDRLRAASRGDLARFGQIEIEMESTLRPKDIQARIRAGASVEQVAAESGMAAGKVERFAYPVLLERSRAAELAQQGHPVRANGPAVETLAEVVHQAFKARGHVLDHVEWDAWKGEDNHWVVQLKWEAGRSTIAAHWRFQLDAHGGAVTALDDTAKDLLDPDHGRARGLMPAPKHLELAAEPAPESEPEAPAEDTLFEDTDPAPRPKKAAAGAPKSKRGKPAMPSWEDVLLGVRSSGH